MVTSRRGFLPREKRQIDESTTFFSFSTTRTGDGQQDGLWRRRSACFWILAALLFFWRFGRHLRGLPWAIVTVDIAVQVCTLEVNLRDCTMAECGISAHIFQLNVILYVNSPHATHFLMRICFHLHQ